jgi:hypothetical protein
MVSCLNELGVKASRHRFKSALSTLSTATDTGVTAPRVIQAASFVAGLNSEVSFFKKRLNEGVLNLCDGNRNLTFMVEKRY